MSEIRADSLINGVGTGSPDFPNGLTSLSINGNGFPSSGALSNRNRIINGDMRIDQRNAGASISLSGAPFPVDRFIARQGQSTSTGQRSSVAPVGFSSSLLYSVTTGASASTGGTGYIAQNIEGNNMSDLNWGTSDAKSVTVSFWVRSSIVGTYGLSISNPANSLGYTTSYSVSSANTWERKTVTFPGSTTGTWAIDNTSFCSILWDLGVGSSYSTSGGTWYSGVSIGLTGGVKLSETTGATFYLTGVQLEVGEVATPFEHRSFGDELARCQRYYIKNVANIWHSDINGSNSTSDLRASVFFPVEMRADPSTITTTIAYISGNTSTTLTVQYARSTMFTTYPTQDQNNGFVLIGTYTAESEL